MRSASSKGLPPHRMLLAALLAIAAGGLVACGRPLGSQPAPACGLTAASFDVDYLDAGSPWDGPGHLGVSDDAVFYTAVGDPSTGTQTAMALDLDRGATAPVSSTTQSTVVLDVRGAALLYGRFDADRWGELELVYRAPSGVEHQLGSHRLQLDHWSSPYVSPGRRMIGQGTVAFSTGLVIYRFDGSAVSQIYTAEQGGSPDAAYHNGHGTVFATLQGSGSKILRIMNGELTEIAPLDAWNRRPVLRQRETLWLCGDGVCAASEPGDRRVVDSGEDCHSLEADDLRAAWICAGRARIYYGPGLGATAARDLPRIDADAEIAGLRLNDGRLAWLEARVDDAGGWPSQAALVYSDGNNAFAIEDLFLPCIFCDMYWPQMELAVRRGVVAWSYAMNTEVPEPGALGYARVAETNTCPGATPARGTGAPR